MLLQLLYYLDEANLLGEKHTFFEGNKRGAFLVAGKECSPVANKEGKVEKILRTKVGKACFGNLIVWVQTITIRNEFMKKLIAD